MEKIHGQSAARGVSLGVRLFLTMVTGHTPYKLMTTFLGNLFMKVDEDVEFWTISGFTDFQYHRKHTVSGTP